MATILISDERPQRRRYLSTLLAHAGHRVREAGSSQEALAGTRSSHPDLVLVNALMPHPGGYQFLRQLHLDPERELPRVLFVAEPYMASEARLLARACGASSVVVDGADAGTLLAAVAAALAEPPPAAAETLAEDVDGDSLYPMLRRLYRRVNELETCNARLERRAAVGAALLQVARSALDREVGKRLGSEQDLTQENQRLRRQSLRDPLTGLYNRRYLEESLAREEGRAQRSGRPLGMMMIDIDHFKRCNDTFGHAVGDAVLRAVSRFMESLARTEDILCRYGGEEFVLVMANTDREMLQQRAEALRSGVSALSIEHCQRSIGRITLSIGLAVFPAHGHSAAAVLQAADAALYEAKRNGRDRIVVAGVGAQQASA